MRFFKRARANDTRNAAELLNKRVLVAVPTRLLKLGMYVAKLDRPWLETPFLFQGFYINTVHDIDLLRENCDYVYVDVDKGVRPVQRPGDDLGIRPQDALITSRDRSVDYSNTTDVREELPRADEAYREVSEWVRALMQDIRAGKSPSLGGFQESVRGMIESILRNPDALLWLTRLQERDAYTYAHSVNSAVLAVTFARHLGMSRDELHHIAVGTLLYDVGKMRLPAELLEKPGRLTAEEFELLKQHVGYSVEIMSKIRGMHRNSLELARTHHERYNGMGYPAGLRAGEIPVFGRIAAIVDCYDAITSDRPYGSSLSRHEAIRKIYEWRDKDFQAELVEQFIQCLGVYPTGSLVELSTGEVGVVFAQNRVRRLRPQVMLVLDADKVAYGSFPIIDLMSESSGADDEPLEIIRAVPPGAYGIDPKKLFLFDEQPGKNGCAAT